MPIQIKIHVNEKLIETVHVARLSKSGLQSASVNTYGVLKQSSEPTNAEWDAAPTFEHRYGDDLTTCALKALQRYSESVSSIE